MELNALRKQQILDREDNSKSNTETNDIDDHGWPDRVTQNLLGS